MLSQVITLFKRKYFRTFQFDARNRHKWKSMRCSKSAGHSVNGCEIVSSTYRYQQGKMMDNNLEMVNDIMRVWWRCHGMPLVMQVFLLCSIYRCAACRPTQ